MQTCVSLQQRRSYYRLTRCAHRDAPRLPRIFSSLVPYIRYFLDYPPMLCLHLHFVSFVHVNCSVHLSRESMSVVRADNEGWTAFLGRRIVLGVSSPDCSQNRTGLVSAGRQRMRVVTGSEGAADESTPDCPHRTVLYYSGSVLPCAYNKPLMPDEALCSRANQDQTHQNEHASCRNPGNRGRKERPV